MTLPAAQAFWFLPFVLPIGLWVAWSDLKFMKIPNKAVYALTAVFVVVGLIAVPLADYPWRLLHLVVVLVVGFGLNVAGALGAGDAKFAAAMAPFIPLADARAFLMLLAAVLLAAFVTHRAARALPALRAHTGDWTSWRRNDFPMGLALGPALVFYLALAAASGL
ncbi:prepilin peptidase [Psychromarinibacter sp. C21-152]|uniref:Prepilin peptidase n=1 Tax=Psychromarinibacter sediminicola TaxID=3033385 RepID=A0AAE3NQH3_9RHOB|nr:prepilin peptidase [Psychromarinibacter sediminicola]MDF0599804.1 prepilin peptidase [Psychromarinibacter sediminicola]